MLTTVGRCVDGDDDRREKFFKIFFSVLISIALLSTPLTDSRHSLNLFLLINLDEKWMIKKLLWIVLQRREKQFNQIEREKEEKASVWGIKHKKSSKRKFFHVELRIRAEVADICEW